MRPRLVSACPRAGLDRRKCHRMSDATATATLPSRTPRGSGAAIILQKLAEIRADLAALWPRKEVWRRYIEAAGVSYSQFCRVLCRVIGPAAVDFVEAVKAATKPAPTPLPAVEQPAPPPPPAAPDAPTTAEADREKLKGIAKFQAEREIRNAIKDAGEAARIKAEAEARSRLASQPAPVAAQTAERPAEQPKPAWQQDYRPKGYKHTAIPDPRRLL
jgi:type IV secretory pathway VirB10-like protein